MLYCISHKGGFSEVEGGKGVDYLVIFSLSRRIIMPFLKL